MNAISGLGDPTPGKLFTDCPQSRQVIPYFRIFRVGYTDGKTSLKFKTVLVKSFTFKISNFEGNTAKPK